MNSAASLDVRPDVDLTDGTFYADGNARRAYRWMRANEPVFRDRNGRVAVATYASVLEAERQPELFSSAGGIRPDIGAIPHMIDMDDPAHLMRRKLVNTGFTRKRVQDKTPEIRALCDALIDAVCERGECDFVRDIAAPLPMAVIGDMLGVLPEDRHTLLSWSDAMVEGLSSHADEATVAAMVEASIGYRAFATDIIAKRRSDPADDLISVLVHAEVEGQRLSEEDIISETLLILIGGDETTRHTLSGGTEQLLRDHDQRERLQTDWDLLPKATEEMLPKATEEMLRWTSPVKNMCRTVTADNEFHGTELHQGEKVFLMFESANFDETVFDDPDEFLIDRNPNSHLAFGFGSHFCLGNQLARLELSIMTRRVLQRLPDLQLPQDVQLPLRPANFVSGLETMPVVFTPTKPLSHGSGGV
jgi:cholest-4-en-3-one 26-monooxygenase